MKNKMKKVLCLALTAVCIVTFAACGKPEGEITGDAVARAQIETDEVYIDDEAIALAGSLSEQDPAVAQAAQTAFTLANQQRIAAGLPALAWNDGLAEAAFVRAQEIVSTFSHTRPNGTDWWTVNSNIMFGENLARYYSTADAAVAGWMASPTHEANIMDASFTTMGIAVYVDSDGRYYWAQEFGY